MTTHGKGKRAEDRARDRGAADQSEWVRLTEGDGFKLAVRLLRQRYGFPMTWEAWLDWLGLDEKIEVDMQTGKFCGGPRVVRRTRFGEELETLARRFGIPGKFTDSLNALVTRNIQRSASYNYGIPAARFERDGERMKMRFEVKDDTDMGSPLVLAAMEMMRAEFREPLPQPPPEAEGGRRDDTFRRQLWEWHLRHPAVTDKEIAALYGWPRRAYVNDIWSDFRDEV